MERKVIKIDRQLHLPLKGKELVLINNRMAAMKRIQSFNKRLERNEPFYSQYKRFKDDLIDKKYARKCDCEGHKGRT